MELMERRKSRSLEVPVQAVVPAAVQVPVVAVLRRKLMEKVGFSRK